MELDCHSVKEQVQGVPTKIPFMLNLLISPRFLAMQLIGSFAPSWGYKILVCVQLVGGSDGNTPITYQQKQLLCTARNS